MRNIKLAVVFVAVLSSIAFASQFPNNGDLLFNVGDGFFTGRECIENRVCNVYPSEYQSLQDIDFRSFPIHLLEGKYSEYRLSNGHYQDHIGSFDLTEIHYLPSNSADAAYVLLVLMEKRSNPRDPAEIWIAQVLQFSKQQWQVVQEFSVALHNRNHPFFAHVFDESTKTLAMRFEGLRDEHDCGTAMDRCTFNYNWNGGRFRYSPPAHN
jgi:hypothetical protein